LLDLYSYLAATPVFGALWGSRSQIPYFPLPKYTSQGIVYRLGIHQSAQADLAAIGREDPDTENDIYALLQEIKGSPRLLESLSIRDFGALRDERFSVDAWAAQQRDGRNLWRLKFWELEGLKIRYRILYALDPRTSLYTVLAVLHRDFNYDSTQARVQQLLDDYDALGIPAYR
jgi:hypothetical protein